MSMPAQPHHPEHGQLLVYSAEDGRLKIDVRLQGETAWLTQQQMAELFQSSKQNVGQHLANIFEEQELAEGSVVKDFFTTAADGKKYRTKHYNLDAIISVGYRVKSAVATRFRIAHKSEEDHEVHLPKDAAKKLLADAIVNYAKANDRRLPDRVVIHKSSGFDRAELDGFNEAAEFEKVRFRDYLALKRSQIRFFRYGSYPPLRGTHIIFDDSNSLLYTRGSVPFYRKYPGPYVPRTLHIRYFQTDRSQAELAAEILALTKLNWNKTQFDSFFPITLAGSKQIGTIYKWCLNPPDEPISYAFFM